MTTVDAYSPLERFLLLETLHPFDSVFDFIQASETLKTQSSNENGRLEPEILQGLYLRLVKEEAGLVQSEATVKSASSVPPRSPHLKTVAHAAQFNHLLPRLLNRLYFDYRDHAIKAIEDEERSIKQLRREIEDIHRAEREPSSRKSSIQTLLRHDTIEDRPPSGGSAHNVKSPFQQNGDPRSTSGFAEDQSRGHLDFGKNSPSVAKLPSLPKDVPSAESQPQAHTSSADSLHFIPPSQQTPSYATAPPASESVRRPSIPSNAPRPILAPSPSPRLNQGPSERSSASPIILPPPPGMRHSGSPQGPLDALAEMAGQQYRARPPGPTPRSGQTVPSQHPPQYPPYQQSPMQYPYYDSRAQYPSPYQPYTPSPAAQYPSHGYSPYQTPMQSASPGHPYANVPPYPPPIPQYSQYSTYGHPQYYPQTPRPGPFGPPAYPASAQQTPQMTASGRPKPPRPSPIVTPASSTRWKKFGDPSSIRAMPSPTRPTRDEWSPMSDRAPSPAPEPSTTQAPEPRAPKSSKSRTKSSRRATTKSQPRRGSTTSISRTRSHSITSPAEPIKPEPPATPAASEAASVLSTTAADDNARRSTRRRRDTMRGREMAQETQRTAPQKRKRASTHTSPEATPSAASTTPGPIQGKILGTRNFPRTSATIMNDITSHKLAGMFARPLTEKEAPGYKDLIYRPQNLKNIKSAIAAGARALTAAENAEGEGEKGGETSVLVNANPDLVPPKGIVNSAQLEKELMRMFANAVMFNPDAKRSVGPAFNTRAKKRSSDIHIPPHLRSKGKEIEVEDDDEEDAGSEVEGGLVLDAREMCEAVEGKVESWRQAEKAAEDREGQGIASSMGERTRLRGGEEGDEEMEDEAMDEVKEREETVIEDVEEKKPTPTVPSKRRRR